MEAMKETLNELKENVMREAKIEKLKKKTGVGSLQSTHRISSWVKQIAKKVPVITKLEKKLGML